MNIDRSRVRPSDRTVITRHRPDDTYLLRDKDAAEERLRHSIAHLEARAELLNAQNERALLLLFQGMDASGKDGAIKHVIPADHKWFARLLVADAINHTLDHMKLKVRVLSRLEKRNLAAIAVSSSARKPPADPRLQGSSRENLRRQLVTTGSGRPSRFAAPDGRPSAESDAVVPGSFDRKAGAAIPLGDFGLRDPWPPNQLSSCMPRPTQDRITR